MKDKKCDLLLVEVSFEDVGYTTVHRLNVINGDYLTPRIIGNGKTVVAQVLELIKIIKEEKPDKVIFDRLGLGGVFYDTFMFMLKHDEYIGVDSFGSVYLKEGN